MATYVNRHAIMTGIQTALEADATVQGVFGSTARIYRRVPRTAATFPWCRISSFPVTPLTKVMTGSGQVAARRVGIQVNCFDNETSDQRVSNGLKAIADILDFAPTNVTVTGGSIFQVEIGTEWTAYDQDLGTWMAVGQWTFSINIA